MIWYQNKKFGTNNPDEVLINPKDCKRYRKYKNCCFNQRCRKDCITSSCNGSLGLGDCHLISDTTSRCKHFEPNTNYSKEVKKQ